MFQTMEVPCFVYSVKCVLVNLVSYY